MAQANSAVIAKNGAAAKTNDPRKSLKGSRVL